MAYILFGLLVYFIVGVGILLRELLLYPEVDEDIHDLIGASIVCVVLWPFFVVWCLREWWAERNG